MTTKWVTGPKLLYCTLDICSSPNCSTNWGILIPSEVVLKELYQKYFFKQMREMFAPWHVLQAIDLSSVGGLNYNCIETLLQMECVEKYQRGVLPSRTSVQKAAYELHYSFF